MDKKGYQTGFEKCKNIQVSPFNKISKKIDCAENEVYFQYFFKMDEKGSWVFQSFMNIKISGNRKEKGNGNTGNNYGKQKLKRGTEFFKGVRMDGYDHKCADIPEDINRIVSFAGFQYNQPRFLNMNVL